MQCIIADYCDETKKKAPKSQTVTDQMFDAKPNHVLYLLLKGVKKVRSAIKLCSYYFSYNVSNGINVTGIL